MLAHIAAVASVVDAHLHSSDHCAVAAHLPKARHPLLCTVPVSDAFTMKRKPQIPTCKVSAYIAPALIKRHRIRARARFLHSGTNRMPP